MGTSSGEDKACWNPLMQPQHLHEILGIIHLLEPRAVDSHIRIIGRMLLAIAIGTGSVATRPDHGGDGKYQGMEIVEVGVYRGEFAEKMLAFLDYEVGAPVKRYTLVDRWSVPPLGVAGGSMYNEEDDDSIPAAEHAAHLTEATA